jgi:hypothetical protein
MSDGEQRVWGEVTRWPDALGDGSVAVGEAGWTGAQPAYGDGQAAAGEHLDAHWRQVAARVEHAHEAGHVLYAAWPNLDPSAVSALTAELHRTVADAGTAAADLADWAAAHQAFQAFQAVVQWAQHAADICAGLPELTEQDQHAALSALLDALGHMHASISGG